tara:strand:+ start:290 stop:862 length:573 start_codon:yes stop_codon:yes gene_type:complete
MNPIKKKYQDLSRIQALAWLKENDNNHKKWNLFLLTQIGFFYLKNKNYKKAIKKFNTCLYRLNKAWRNEQMDPRGLNGYYLESINLQKTYFFRGLAFALSGDFDKSDRDYSKLILTEAPLDYLYFLDFSRAVLKKDSELAIRNYLKSKKYSPRILEFEEDLFNLLPIENIENLNESIKLIDFSLGIVRKK